MDDAEFKYRIVVPIPVKITLEEFEEWLIENCQGLYVYGEADIPWLNVSITFQYEIDAVAFKLRWL